MESKFRIEKDILGSREIPGQSFYGIHSQRAKENFPDNSRFHIEWYKAIGITKLACYNTYGRFKSAALQKYGKTNPGICFMDDKTINALIYAADEVAKGNYFEHFIVPAVQGGAGTSINMNVNEIIANIALYYLQYKPGTYHIIDPIENANIFQSTNDVIPTSLKLVVIKLLNELEESINKLRFEIEKLENQYRNVVRIGFTQMQKAVPSSFDKLFSSYNDALSRDWWRISKCFERIKTVNLGGSAIGTGITVPRFFIMEVVTELQRLTKLPLTRAENLSDATSNLDSFVEVHAILKSHAVNIEKMVADIRLMSSGLIDENEIEIPEKQAGSSIMPGKINPVIVEFAISAVHKIYSNDMLISNLCGQGCLELNAYVPQIGQAIIESLKLLIAVNKTLKDNLFDGLKVNTKIAEKKLYNSYAIVTALVPYIGYHKAELLAKEMKNKSISIFRANNNLKLIDNEKLGQLMLPQNLLKKGFSLDDLA